MTVKVTTLSISEIGIQLLLLDHEREENNRTIRRLENDLSVMRERLANLRVRQSQIDEVMEKARAIPMPGARYYLEGGGR